MDNQWGPHQPKEPSDVLRIYIDNHAPVRDFIKVELEKYLMKQFQTARTPHMESTGGHKCLVFKFDTREHCAMARARF